MLGYKIVPTSLYDLMLAALSTRADLSSPASEAHAAAVPVRTPAPVTEMSPTWPTGEMPEVVCEACERFGYGSPDETSANYRRAAELMALGHSPREIVREIQRGADIALYV